MTQKKRYIIKKVGLELLSINTEDACAKLSQPTVITNENLHFNTLQYASVMLSEEEANILREANIYCKEEVTKTNVCLGADYEKVRSFFYRKPLNKNLTGAGCKVAIMDSGCNLIGTPNVTPSWTDYDFGENFADANPDVTDNFGHGTRVASTVRSSVGLANGCELHIVRVIDDIGMTTESAMLAGIDYCLNNDIDIVNMSFTFNSTAFDSAVASLIADGCVVAAATGNSTTPDVVLPPASLPDVIAVNGITESGTPHYSNILGSKPVSIACSGVGCEGISGSGSTAAGFGTSFACPFFVGAFAIYKQKLGITDNIKIAEHILQKAIKMDPVEYFGNGIVTF